MMLRRLSILLGIVSALVILTGTAYSMWRMRVDGLTRAEWRVRDLAALLAEQSARAIEQIDGRLIEAGAAAAHHAGKRGLVANEWLHDLLRAHQDLPQMRVLALIDAQGALVALSDRYPPPQTRLDDRDHFRAHRDRAASDLFIGAPTTGRATGEYVLPLSRRIDSANGAFLGVIVAGFDLRYFDRLPAPIELGRGGSVRWFHRNGTLIAGQPIDGEARGTRPEDADPLLKRLGSKTAAIVHETASAEPHLTAVRAVARYPLVTTVSLNQATIMQTWVREAWMAGTLGVFAAAFVLGLTAALARRLRIDAKLRTDLRDIEARWRFALEGAEHGVFDWDMTKGHIYRSERFLAMVGHADPDLGADAPAPATLVHPDDRERAARFWDDCRAGHRTQFAEEYRLVRRDGSVFAALLSGGIVARDPGGSPARLIGTVTDVNRLKEAEAQVRRSQEQLRELSIAMLEVRESERTRISRELHDELGQTLTALKMDVDLLDALIPADCAGLRERTASMRKLLDFTVATTRRISEDLRPLVLDDLGLSAAAEWLAQNFSQRSGVPCDLRLDPWCAALGEPHASTFFRIMQESFTNVARHARATRVQVRLERDDDHAVLSIRDDGIGIDRAAQAKPRAFGLRGISERVLLLGGTLEIASEPGNGTAIIARIPLAMSVVREAA
jgi:PAS domain S-box-containing protein